ncbi:MAG: hypothetical protein D6766_04735 [Verrucomicrobia bacterium]|nr:MAG: hypothetical protein D6766_04735 [Verrucomicrobiota bacterium]
MELLVSVATVGMLAWLHLGVVGGLRSASDDAQCLANLQTLTRAWQMYGLEHELLPPNPDDGNLTPGHNWAGGFAGVGMPHEFNPDILENPETSLLFPYLGDAGSAVFRCPADTRMGTYQGNRPELQGAMVAAARSYAMNLAVGTNPYADPPRPVDAPWLDNQHAHHYGQKWRTYGTFGDMIAPAPARLVVFLGENAYSLNDASFSFGMEREEWIDWPATRHGMAGAIAYADGHAEIRAWQDDRTVVQNGHVSRRAVPGSPDYAWLRARISAPIQLEHPLLAPPTPVLGLNHLRVAWPASEAGTYRAEVSADLQNWQPLAEGLEPERGQIVVEDPDASEAAARFYRLVR